MNRILLMLFCIIVLNSFAQKNADSLLQKGISATNMNFSSGGTVLYASLFMPKHPVAALVLIHGSGQEKRMTNLALRLCENGLAVFTYDKRGVGKSGGKYAGPEVGTNNIDTANLNLLALDASAAADKLSEHLTGKAIPIGLMGFSQAAWIAPLAASNNKNVKFLTLFSAPVATTLEQLRFQFYTNGNTKFWDTHDEAQAREHIANDPDKYQFAPTDPRHALTEISIPGLWLYGGKDIQAPVGLSAERLDVLKAKGKMYTYKLYPELGHNTGYSASKEPFDFALQWIKSVAGRK